MMRQPVNNRVSGVTLLELMIFIGIMFAVGVASLVGFQRAQLQSRLDEVAQQVFSDLVSARDDAQRYNTSVHFTLAKDSYTITQDDPPSKKERPVPQKVTMELLQGNDVITYTPPFGETTNPDGWIIELKSETTARMRSRYIKVIGVTGKVILDHQP